LINTPEQRIGKASGFVGPRRFVMIVVVVLVVKRRRAVKMNKLLMLCNKALLVM
jgi:hypothetical protein